MDQPTQQWVAILSHGDRSGILAVFGPWDSDIAAKDGSDLIRHSLPLQDGVWDFVRLLAPYKP